MPSVCPRPSKSGGTFDAASCTSAVGWTCDPDNYNQALWVHFYKGGPAGGGGQYVSAVITDRVREPGVGALCGNNTAHGFSFTIPPALKNGATHTLYAHAINILSNGTIAGNNPVLQGSPKSVICPVSELLARPAPNVCGVVNQPTQFDGSASISTANPPRPITSYLWDFGDSYFGPGVKPTHTYTVATTTTPYNVTLTIGDDLGRTSDLALTTARIYPAMGNALSIDPPLFTHGVDQDSAPVVYAQASTRAMACSNWAPIIRVVVEEYLPPVGDLQQGIWMPLDDSGLIPAVKAGGLPGYSATLYKGDSATAWRMRVFYYVRHDGIDTLVASQTKP